MILVWLMHSSCLWSIKPKKLELALRARTQISNLFMISSQRSQNSNQMTQDHQVLLKTQKEIKYHQIKSKLKTNKKKSQKHGCKCLASELLITVFLWLFFSALGNSLTYTSMFLSLLECSGLFIFSMGFLARARNFTICQDQSLILQLLLLLWSHPTQIRAQDRFVQHLLLSYG